MQQYTELCYCVSYSRTLILESALGNAVVENTNHMHGVFVPPILKKASRVFFLQIIQTLLNIHNAGGKGSGHGTYCGLSER